MDRDEDTLSFASLVQPDLPKKPQTSTRRRTKQKQLSSGPSFEFRSTGTSPSCTADVLFANGSILPQHMSPADQKGPSRGRRRCLKEGNGRRSADSAPKRVSFQEFPTPKHSTSSPLPQRRTIEMEIKAKRDTEKSRGLLGSIFLVCRECRAVEPSAKRVGHVARA